MIKGPSQNEKVLLFFALLIKILFDYHSKHFIHSTHYGISIANIINSLV